MSAPITEAHRKLRETLEIRWMRATELEIEQLIADSEERAVQIAMLREYGNLCATNEGLAKECDQLRAERDWLKTWQDQAETNYVIGEPLAKKLRDTEAERDQLLAALALGQKNCDEAYDDLRAERDAARAELADEKNLRAQTRTVVEELNTICTDLRNAGGPPFIRSEAIRLLREDQATLRAEVERLTAQRENLLKPMRDQAIARAERAEAELAAAKLLLNEETDCAEAVEAAIVRQYARAERAEAELAECKESLHLADGTANLALVHRDAAEAEVKRLKTDGAASAFIDMSCRASRAEAELAAERARHIALRKAVLDVLCDHEGKACFVGSDGDRAAIDAAMKEGAK
jgi:hypothetical protein